jgi:hypothetical protein
MVERYRSHLIFVKGYIDSAHHIWKASLHVQFNEDTQTFRDVYLPPPTGRFTGKTSAEKNGIKEAKSGLIIGFASRPRCFSYIFTNLDLCSFCLPDYLGHVSITRTSSPTPQ